MANPKLEDGFTQISNEILVALSFMSLSPNESRLLHCIIRQTYGWHKKEDWISQSQFTEKTGIIRQNVWRALEGLKRKKMVVIGSDYKKYPTYGFQKDYDKWKMVHKTRNLMLKEMEKEREKRKKSIGPDYTNVSEVRYTKYTVTKNTVKKEKRESDANSPFSPKEENRKNEVTQEDTQRLFGIGLEEYNHRVMGLRGPELTKAQADLARKHTDRFGKTRALGIEREERQEVPAEGVVSGNAC